MSNVMYIILHLSNIELPCLQMLLIIGFLEQYLPEVKQ